MLAVYETFGKAMKHPDFSDRAALMHVSGSLTSGEEPTLLAPGNTDWWCVPVTKRSDLDLSCTVVAGSTMLSTATMQTP